MEIQRVAVALAFTLAGCGGGRTGAPTSAPVSTTPLSELEALHNARADSALMRFTATDADFMSRMIGHHAQALAMAALVPSRASDRRIHRLAARITAAQEAEIGLMRQWLVERGQTMPDRGAAPGGADHAGGGGFGSAPGMVSPEQMRELAAAEGGAFDRLFLSLMIQHHRGAVTMVERLFAIPGAAADPSTFRIASGIQVDQRSEIGRMQSMLVALDGARPGLRAPPLDRIDP